MKPHELSTKPPFSWFGAKSEFIDFIISSFPEHKTFVDVCGGAGSVTLWKAPSEVDVYNDADVALVNFFKVCRENPEKLAFALALTPYAKYQFDEDKKNVSEYADDPNQTDWELARRFATVARQSMSGHFGRAWSSVVAHSRRGMSSSCSRWINLPEAIIAISARLQTVQIECGEWFEVVDKYDRPETLFYVDPPYLPETRPTSKDVYRVEMNEEDHVELLDTLRHVQGKVVLSGYDSDLYNVTLRDWERRDLEVKCRSNVKTDGTIASNPKRVEVLWIKS